MRSLSLLVPSTCLLGLKRLLGLFLVGLFLAVAGADPAFAADSGIATFVKHNMAPVMFVALVVFLLLGYPVAFALAANGLFFAVIGIELGLFQPNFLQALPERVYGTMNNDVLLAIPFFTLMGLILERSGMAEDLLDTIGQLFGTVRGGLAYAVIFVGALLAATTGVVAASVIAMGLISLPIMLRYGYDRRLASGVIAASGTLAQIIPPSLVLIVMADQLGRSVGDMYEGAFIPGLILSGLYASYVFLVTVAKPDAAPGLPPDAQTIHEDGVNRPVRTLINVIGAAVVIPAVAGAFLAGGIYLMAILIDALINRTTSLHLPLSQIGYVAMAAGAATAALLALRAFQRGGFAQHARANLATLTAAAAVAAYVIMAGSRYRGADFVVLTMSIAVAIAFAVAVLNRFLQLGLLSKMSEEVTFVMVPPLALIFLVLGTIFIGVATPTEGGAMGAVGAIALAYMKRVTSNQPHRLNWEIVRSACEATAKLSAFVVFILLGARVFSLTFYGVDGHKWVEELLLSLPGGQVGFLIFVNILIFLLAFFLDFFELAFIAVPLIGPAAEKIGIDLIWFGVILGVNMQTSFMHPPFGFALFYLRSVAAKDPYVDRVTGQTMAPVTTGQIYWGAVPFVVIQVIMVALVILFPQMVMHYKSQNVVVDPKKVEDQLRNLQIPGIGAPPTGLPGVPVPGGLPPPPPPILPGLPPPPPPALPR